MTTVDTDIVDFSLESDQVLYLNKTCTKPFCTVISHKSPISFKLSDKIFPNLDNCTFTESFINKDHNYKIYKYLGLSIFLYEMEKKNFDTDNRVFMAVFGNREDPKNYYPLYIQNVNEKVVVKKKKRKNKKTDSDSD